jgi:medium-chain acyl-[acyl-carrier-protein] hydrolase
MLTATLDACDARSWLYTPVPHEHAAMRLFCFPYAGGSVASFAGWAARLRSVEVTIIQLPRRRTGIGDRLTHVRDVVRHLGPALEPLMDAPFAFFGHSLGSLLAYETACHLRARGLRLPAQLYVSGHRAPHLPDTGVITKDASDEAFIEFLVTLGGTPPEMLANRELMDVLLPILRADIDLCRTYAWASEPPLACPITVFAGEDDEEGAAPYVTAWQLHTTHTLRTLRCPGGHFFLQTAAQSLLSALDASLVATRRRLGV